MRRIDPNKDFSFRQVPKTAKEINQAFRDRRKATGLCERCGKRPRLDDYTVCEECRVKQAESSKKAYDTRVENNQCTCCKKKVTNGQTLCDECSTRNSKNSKERRTQYNAEGRCRDCGKEADTGHTACADCRAKGIVNTRERRARYVTEGRCRECGEDGQIADDQTAMGKKRKYRYCERCWFRLIARSLLGSSDQWSVLVDKWITCGKRCPYTGEELVPGINLSFDHMDPRSRFPEKANNPDNIEPVSWRVNLIKGDLTKSEFLALVDKIHLHTTKR